MGELAGGELASRLRRAECVAVALGGRRRLSPCLELGDQFVDLAKPVRQRRYRVLPSPAGGVHVGGEGAGPRAVRWAQPFAQARGNLGRQILKGGKEPR